MLRQSETLWARIQPLLTLVEQPARYIGEEFNSSRFAPVVASHTDSELDVALVYPDIYDLGGSNQALVILRDVCKQLAGVNVERAYLPWLDMIGRLRENDIPLFSLESKRALADFDVIGITLPHELAPTNILEFLDLAKVPLHASARTEQDPIILGGGPMAFNPAPLAVYFDAIAVGDGEEVFVEILQLLEALKQSGVDRNSKLQALAGIEGLYVPGYTKGSVDKRVVKNFDVLPVVTDPIVPFIETTQDRLTVEISRGCSRGCRFCQAGMTYRPVRERSADTVVQAVTEGLANTGLDEVSLTSLSSTDHSQIEQILRRLNQRYAGTDVKISLPSQRLDAFGVSMSHLVCGAQKKGSLTFAPEAGTQRLRDVINKNVSQDDLTEAIQAAYGAGWRRCKLYFMLGLPTETDEDIAGIAKLANHAYFTAKDSVPDDQRGSVRVSVSVAVFVPKAHTPFQWCGQISFAELERRINLLRNSGLHKGIDLHWHEPSSSLIEAVVSRGDATTSELIEQAWRNGARFDAWSDQFKMQVWLDAAASLGLDLHNLAQRDFAINEALPWDFIDSGISKQFLAAEYQASIYEQTTADCTFASCTACGVCTSLDAHIELEAPRG